MSNDTWETACTDLACYHKQIERIEAIQEFRRTDEEKQLLRTYRKTAKRLEKDIKTKYQPRLF